MDLEREDRLELLFERAAALPSGQRSAFVEAACGADGELRAILTALVADADDAHGYVERVAGPIVATAIRATLGDTSVGTHANGRNGGPDTFAGQHIDHFRVLDRLGSGGMGVVYKAIDVRLDRTVALKFLPPHLGTDEQAKRRFVHEAKAASALDHPNICAIHETGETATGQLFIAMAHYEGETLKEKIARGPLPIRDVLDYVAQIAAGLQCAHDAGIVHRDVKPANLIVTSDGRVAILDFGLAKIARAEVTHEGAAVGTVAYMSPEQTRGVDVDAQTDIWSLGAVLYELLTGQRAFSGETDETVIHAIRHDQPRPVRLLRPDVPAGVAVVVSRCLTKDPTRRYSRADELVSDVRTLQQGGSLRRSLRPKQVLRSSATALLGSVLLLTGPGLTRVAHRVDPEAFSLYLRGKRTADNAESLAYFTQAIAKDSVFAPAYSEAGIRYVWAHDRDRAEQAIEKAIALDPSLSDAYEALGLLRMWLDWNWPAAEAALRRAIGLNPHNALAHHELGQLLTRVGRCDDAIPEVERAVLENPVYPNFQSGLAEVYFNCRRYERAIDEFEKALPLARDSDAIYRDIGDAYFFQGKYTTALASYRKARWVPGWAYVPLGDRQRALAQIDTLTRRWAAGRAAPYEPYLLAKLYTSLGDRDQAITWLERLYGARTGLVVYLKVQPHFDPLRGEPRFQALLKKAGLND